LRKFIKNNIFKSMATFQGFNFFQKKWLIFQKLLEENLIQKEVLETYKICYNLWFGNVLDSRGSVIPTFREQIKKGGPVTVTDPKMERYFMLIPEACLLVMQASAMGKGGEVFVLDMGKSIKILDLAKAIIEASGLVPDKDIAIVFSGKRPGEKLFEEILTAEEGVISTPNQRIFIANLSSIDGKRLQENLSLLSSKLDGLEKEEIVKILRKILPNYL